MFAGFTKETVSFMWGIRFNNEKSWFEAHKQEYLDYFYHPMKQLADEAFRRFSEAHGDLSLIRKISRIYRDARRLHGQGPYKENLWWSMERPSEDWTDQPVFWFELGPEAYSYGLGYYAASAQTMAKYRARIDRDPAALEKLVNRFEKQDRFALEGPDYKRPQGDPGARLYPWYQKKSLSLICTRGHEDILFSPGLADALVRDYELLLPFYHYFLAVGADPDPRG